MFRHLKTKDVSLCYLFDAMRLCYLFDAMRSDLSLVRLEVETRNILIPARKEPILLAFFTNRSSFTNQSFSHRELHLPTNNHHPQYRQTSNGKTFPCHCDYRCPSHSPSDRQIGRLQTSYCLLITRHFFTTPLRLLQQPIS